MRHLHLEEKEEEYLHDLLDGGHPSSRLMKRAQGLLYLNKGRSYTEVGELVRVGYRTVSEWARRYRAGGLSKALADEPRSGRPARISGDAKAKITALACSRPPSGYSSWSLRLLSDKIVGHISHTEVGKI